MQFFLDIICSDITKLLRVIDRIKVFIETTTKKKHINIHIKSLKRKHIKQMMTFV